ncbi:MAG: tyrosine-protein phosphatase [Neisseriaceae bacterium]
MKDTREIVNELSNSIPNFRIACFSEFQFSGSLALVPCIYRSGNIHSINQCSASRITKDLGIECHVDLRSIKEVQEQGYPDIIIENGVKLISYPLADYNNPVRRTKFPTFNDYSNYYYHLIMNNKTKLTEIINFIATSQYKRFLFSCYAGKDRTGIIIILIMLIIGINVDPITYDYALSGKYLTQHIEVFQYNWEKRGLTKEDYIARLTPDKRTITTLITMLLTEFDTIDNFLLNLGISKEIVDNLKKKFYTYASRKMDNFK